MAGLFAGRAAVVRSGDLWAGFGRAEPGCLDYPPGGEPAFVAVLSGAGRCRVFWGRHPVALRAGEMPACAVVPGAGMSPVLVIVVYCSCM